MSVNSEARKKEILRILQEAEKPVSGTALAQMLGVSRQMIVQDIALLRARSDLELVSTYRGYILIKRPEVCTRVFKVRHGAERTEEELQLMVDLGGTVEDVFVYHRVYGVVRGQLDVASRRDICEFMERLADSSSAPLMQITDDFHYHTVTARDERALDRIEQELSQRGFLAPLREHEPDGVSGR